MDAHDTFKEHGAPTSDILVGQLFAGKYEILELLGRGGMGAVFKARNRVNGQLRAVKVLHLHLVSDANSLRRFEAEANAAARIKHPHAITIIDVGVSDSGRPYIVMEYVHGRSLSEVLKFREGLPISTASYVFSQICSALSEAHHQGVVHRDIKPSNVMLLDNPDDQFFVKVVDFGIAKVMPQSMDGTVVETATGEVFGSPPYMSPEQCLGQKLDHRSDIYSLGCLMYETLTGRPPLVGDNQISTLYKQINDEPEPITLINEDVRLVELLDHIIAKAMNKNPGGRYQKAEEMQAEIESSLALSKNKLKMLSAVQLILSKRYRRASNALGTSKKIVLVIAGLVSLVLIVGCSFLSKYALTRAPSAESSRIDWRSIPTPSTMDWRLRVKWILRKDELVKKLEASLNGNEGKYNPESLWLCRQLGDHYFEDGIYDSAIIRYATVLAQGTQLFIASHETYEASPLVHEIALSETRYAQCLTHLHDIGKAYRTARAAQVWSFKDNSKDEIYKVYLSQLIGITTEKLGGSISVVNEYCGQFTRFIDSNGSKGFSTLELAPALSAVGDCYAHRAEWERAAAAYEKAQKEWTLLRKTGIRPMPASGGRDLAIQRYWDQADFGDFNIGVSNAKLAAIYEHMNRDSDALICYEKAANEFSLLGESAEIPKAKVLFQEAALLWKRGEYLKSWTTRIAAVKIWSSKSHNN